MRTLKITGLILAGMLAIAPVASAHGFGGGGGFHGGGGGFGGGHFAGGYHGGWHGGHWYGGRWYGGHWYGGHWYGGRDWYGGPYWWWGYPGYYGYDYYDSPDAYYDSQAPDVVTPRSNSIAVVVQQSLAKLGYYHGSIDGIVGPETRKAIRRFQSADNLPLTGQIDSQTLKALQIH